MILKITFLGTSASIPTKKRGQISIAVQRGKNLLLFDAGEGVQRAIIESKIGFKNCPKGHFKCMNLIDENLFIE